MGLFGLPSMELGSAHLVFFPTQLKQLNIGHIWAAVQSLLGGHILPPVPLVSFKNMPFFKVED